MKHYRSLAPISSRSFDRALHSRNPDNADFDINTGRPITDEGWEAYQAVTVRWPNLSDAEILDCLLDGPEIK